MASYSNRSTAAEVLTLCLPSLVALAAGAVSGYVLDSATAVALVLPITVVAHAITLAWSRRLAAGAFFGMLLGVLLRSLVVVGGAGVLFFGTDLFRARGLSLWVWLIGVYLSTLAVETVLLGRTLRRSSGVPL